MASTDPPERSSGGIGKDTFHPERRVKKKKLKPSALRWVLLTVGWTFVISILLSYVSSTAMDDLGLIPALMVLLMFIMLGICFDIIGVAVATADDKPFHSMATRRVKGSVQALRFIRSAEKVASFCNDVVGDISGIISGATTTIIASSLIKDYSLNALLTQAVFSGIVSALMVGGKALGKVLAMKKSTEIVLFIGYIRYRTEAARRLLRNRSGDNNVS